MRAPTISFPSPSYRHLLRMCDGTALFEHAWHHVPRWEHGYCTDDVARALLTVSRVREPARACELDGVASMALGYLRAACLDGCPVRTRLDHRRDWVDEGPCSDTDGRVLWALGTAIASSTIAWIREAAADLFASLAPSFDAPFPRSLAFAALGAGEVLRSATVRDAPVPGGAEVPGRAECAEAERLLLRVAPRLARPRCGAAALCAPMEFGEPVFWPWPEDRLTYANGAIPEALIAAGTVLGDAPMVDDGLFLLRWLVGLEHGNNGFSFTSAGGRGPGERGPAFDQQPIEAAAMTDACWRAWRTTGDERWADEALVAASWFLGLNDAGLALYDETTGAGADGLRRASLNINRGAESTLAALTALQRAEEIVATRESQHELLRRSDASSSGASGALDGERVEQRSLVDDSRTDAAIGGTVGEIDLPVVEAVHALYEDDVVDITDTFPLELRFENGFREDGADHSGRRVQQRNVHRVVAVGTTLMEEQQQTRVALEGRRTGADTETSRARADDGVLIELVEVALPVHLVGAPKVFEIVEHRDLHVRMDAVYQRHATVGQVEDHRVLVGNTFRAENACAAFVDNKPVAVLDKSMRADLPRTPGARMVQAGVRHDEMIRTRTIGAPARNALDTRILDGKEVVPIARQKHLVESVVAPVVRAEQQHVAHIVEEASAASGVALIPVAHATCEKVVPATVMEQPGVEQRPVPGRATGCEQRAVADATGPWPAGAGVVDRRHGHAFSSERERSGWIPIVDANARFCVAEQFAHSGPRMVGHADHAFADSPTERRMR